MKKGVNTQKLHHGKDSDTPSFTPYAKDTTEEGNMNTQQKTTYTPTHVMNKKTGDIPAAGMC